MPLIFVTGPTRSGKSVFAEHLALAGGARPCYVATSERLPDDAEWSARVARHRQRRGDRFTLVETAEAEARSLDALLAGADEAQVLLVDSLGTWLAHRLTLQLRGGGAIDAAALRREAEVLAVALAASSARVVAVSEEVGWGLVPLAASARVFADVLGELNRRVAAAAQHAYVVVAGYALDLKQGVAVDSSV